MPDAEGCVMLDAEGCVMLSGRPPCCGAHLERMSLATGPNTVNPMQSQTTCGASSCAASRDGTCADRCRRLIDNSTQ